MEVARDRSINYHEGLVKKKKFKIIFLSILFIALILLAILTLFVGPSNLTIGEVFSALFFQGDKYAIKIIWDIRMLDIIAGILAGASLSLAGVIMQTCLGNIMASPSTLGVSNAAVFGANIAIIIFAGGFINTGNNAQNLLVGANPYSTSIFAFIFAIGSTVLILALSKIKNFSPNVVVLAGVAMGALWTAGTTLVQYYATDIGLEAAVIWSFGDLSRATYTSCLIMLVVLIISTTYFLLMSWRYNALLGGDDLAKSLGIKVAPLRFVSLLLSSLLTATSISFVGLIGFVGLICPHISRRILGNDHRFLIPSSILSGSFLLVFAHLIGTLIGRGTALPVGAITAILGAPFFLYIIFTRGGKNHA